MVDMCLYFICCSFFFFKQKTAYEMRISDWSSDVCSSDLSLAEAVNGSSGKTVLYTPVFEFGNVVEAAKSKDLVQQVDSIVIHWTKQLKNVLNNHDNPTQAAELTGPLDEINFWKVRADDLLGIQQQLEQQEIVDIISLLEIGRAHVGTPVTN